MPGFAGEAALQRERRRPGPWSPSSPARCSSGYGDRRRPQLGAADRAALVRSRWRGMVRELPRRARHRVRAERPLVDQQARRQLDRPPPRPSSRPVQASSWSSSRRRSRLPRCGRRSTLRCRTCSSRSPRRGGCGRRRTSDAVGLAGRAGDLGAVGAGGVALLPLGRRTRSRRRSVPFSAVVSRRRAGDRRARLVDGIVVRDDAARLRVRGRSRGARRRHAHVQLVVDVVVLDIVAFRRRPRWPHNPAGRRSGSAVPLVAVLVGLPDHCPFPAVSVSPTKGFAAGPSMVGAEVDLGWSGGARGAAAVTAPCEDDERRSSRDLRASL